MGPAGRRKVLVLGSEWNRTFKKLLSEMRFVPSFVSSLEGLIHAIRHMQAAAILVDRDQHKADELELVLNVRDLDGKIPIVLIGSSSEEGTDAILSNQPSTFLIRKSTSSRSLAADLRALPIT
jgi:DNA-binding response OmpR family regulator